MSTGFSAQAPVAKLCARCGQDVSHRERVKDGRGRYFCATCWSKVQQQPRAASSRAPAVAVSTPAVDQPDLLFCEVCRGRFAPNHLTMDGGRVICQDCRKAPPPPGTIGLNYATGNARATRIATTNWIVTAAAIFGIFCPPIGMPLQVWAAIRLLKLLDRDGAWGWIVSCSLPWLGLIPLKLLVDRSGKAFNRPASKIRVFDRGQEERYRQLLSLRRYATPMILVTWIVGALARGSNLHLLLFPVGVVGMFVAIYAEIRLRPFRKAIKQAGGVKIWFAASADVVNAYERRF